MADTIKTMGIVLKSSKHTKDASRLLEIFSPERGKFSAVIRGVEKPKAKLASASQPFCFGEFILVERGGYYTVTDCFVQDSFFSLVSNLDKYVFSCCFLEVCSHLAQEGESNLELFKLLLSSLKIMAYEEVEPSTLAIKFFIEALQISGFGFDISTCSICQKSLKDIKNASLIYSGQGAVCNNHALSECVRLSPSEWQCLSKIAFTSLDNIAELKDLSREDLDECLKIMLKQFYYRSGEKISSLTKYF